MQMSKLIQLSTIAGKGVLAGFGLGSICYAVLFMSLNTNNQQAFNIGAYVALLAGGLCLFIALKKSKYLNKARK